MLRKRLLGIEANHVDRVRRIGADTRGHCGSGLHRPDFAGQVGVALAQGPHKRQVDVSTEDQIGTRGSPAMHRQFAPDQQILLLRKAWYVHGLVHHDDSQRPCPRLREANGGAFDLLRAYPSPVLSGSPLYVHVPGNTETLLRVISWEGAMVMEKSVMAGGDVVLELPILPSGVYVLDGSGIGKVLFIVWQ